MQAKKDKKIEIVSPDISNMTDSDALKNVTPATWPEIVKKFSTPKKLFEEYMKAGASGNAGSSSKAELPGAVLEKVKFSHGEDSHAWVQDWVQRASGAIQDLQIAFAMKDKLKKYIGSLFYGQQEKDLMTLFNLELEPLQFVKSENIENFFKLLDEKKNARFAEILELNRFKIGEVLFKCDQLSAIAKEFVSRRTAEIIGLPLLRSGTFWRISSWMMKNEAMPTQMDVLTIASECYDYILHKELMCTMRNPMGILLAFEQGMTDHFEDYICETIVNDSVHREHPCSDLLKSYARVIQEDEETHQVGLEVVKAFFGAYSFQTSLRVLEDHIVKYRNEIPYEDLLQMCLASVATDKYPLNAALLYSDFMKRVGTLFVNEEYFKGQAVLSELAVNIVESIPSDKAALQFLMQKPGDKYDEESAKYVALRTNNELFFASPRISRVVSELYDNPKVFRGTIGGKDIETDWSIIKNRLVRNLAVLGLWGGPGRLFLKENDVCLLYSIYNLPMMRFSIRTFGYFLFLIFFCVFLFTRSGSLGSDSPFTALEIVLYIFSLSFLVEEMKQMFIAEKLYDYFSNGWNLIDLIIGMSFGLLLAIRITGVNTDWPLGSETRQGLDSAVLALFATTGVAVPIRVLSVFKIWIVIGPFIKIIGKMTRDIARFLFLAALIWIGFSIGFTFLLDPGLSSFISLAEGEDQVNGFKGLDDATLTLFSSFLGTFEIGDFDVIGNEKLRQFSRFYFVLYLGISLVVLFNLLIAMMTTTYENVQNAVTKEHLLERARLIYELYQDDGVLPPPFTLFAFAIAIAVHAFQFLYSGFQYVFCSGSRGYSKHSTQWYCQTCFKNNEDNSTKIHKYVKEYCPSLSQERISFLFPENVTLCSYCFYMKNKAEDLEVSKISFTIIALFLNFFMIIAALIRGLNALFMRCIPGYATLARGAMSRGSSDDTMAVIKGSLETQQWPDPAPITVLDMRKGKRGSIIGQSEEKSHADRSHVEKSVNPGALTIPGLGPHISEKKSSHHPEESKLGADKKLQMQGLHSHATMLNIKTNITARRSKVARIKVVQSYSPTEAATMNEVVTVLTKVDGKINDIRNMLLDATATEESAGPPWKYLYDFNGANEYTAYLQKNLKPGMLVLAVKKYEVVKEGEIGEYVQHNDNFPPCQIRWRDYGGTYWVYWKDIRIIEGEEENVAQIIKDLQSKKGAIGPPWKKFEDFKEDEKAYVDYCRKNLAPGMKLICREDNGGVTKGQMGELVSIADGQVSNPLKVWWSGISSLLEVPFTAVTIIDGEDEAWKDLGEIVGPPWKSLSDFENELGYINYMKAAMQTPGRKLRCTKGYECIPEGDVGEFVQWNELTPPCQVNWQGYEGTYWLYWRDLKIVSDTPEEKVPRDVAGDDRAPWKTMSDFSSEYEYSLYLKASLKPGMRMRAVRTYESVNEDDEGEYVQHNSSWPPCQVKWDGYGSTYWMFWRDLEICEGADDEWKNLGEILPPWKIAADFSKKRDYKTYMRAALSRPGLKVKCTKTFEGVLEGDVGIFEKWDDEKPPVHVRWLGLESFAKINFENLKIVDGTDEEELKIEDVPADISPPWRRKGDFASEIGYYKYLKKSLQKDMKIRYIGETGEIRKYTIGSFVGIETDGLPVHAEFRGIGFSRCNWVDVEIVEGMDESSLIESPFGPPWKTLENFSGNLEEYTAYLKEALQPGMLIRAVRSSQSVMEGDIGEHTQWNEYYPPCQAFWRSLGTEAWVQWSDIEIVHGTPRATIPQVLAEPSATWKGPRDFKTENEYATYLKALLKPDMKVICTNDFEGICRGDIGTYIQHNGAYPPCQISWNSGTTYWMYWRDIRIIQDVPEAEVGELIKTCYKTAASFCSDDEYAEYVKNTVQEGFKVRALNGYELIHKWDLGVVKQWNDGWPPCQVEWQGYGSTYWVPWKEIVIVEGSDMATDDPPVESVVGPPWKTVHDFPSEVRYKEYILAYLQKDMKVMAISGPNVGCRGIVKDWNDSYPPCYVEWIGQGGNWSYWRDIKIFDLSDLKIPVEKWKRRSDFGSDEEYGEYNKSKVKKGMTVRMRVTYESAIQGDVGEVVQWNDGYPPCQVAWQHYGSTYWVFWKDIDIVHGIESESTINEISETDLEVSAPFRTVADFSSEVEHAAYLKKLLKPGAKVEIINDYEAVTAGDTGTVEEWNTAWPPLRVTWERAGSYWVFFRDIKVISLE